MDVNLLEMDSDSGYIDSDVFWPKGSVKLIKK